MSTIFREKKSLTLKPLAVSIALIASSASTSTQAAEEGSFIDALTGGKAFANLRLRYENADLAGVGAPNADALTLDTSFGYKSKDYYGWSFLVEAEDVREVAGVRDFSVPPAGVRSPGGVPDFDIIADPETTELDQAFVQFKSNGFLAKLGRQVITHDGHRFIGHVGWRQDRQTYDGLTLGYESGGLALTGSYVTQRNRIFAEVADATSDDIFLNASYKFGGGKLVAYSYLLDDETTNTELDTYGISYNGKFKSGSTGFNYGIEYATQDNENTGADTDYFHINGGAKFGAVKLGLGYELLGSDDGTAGFATPLATLHKFNGWADVFLATPAIGLQDAYASLDVAIAGGKGGNFKLVFHDFTGDEDNAFGEDDLGDEVDIQYTYNFNKHVYSGIKYANYNAGEAGNADTERFWAWVGFKFK